MGPEIIDGWEELDVVAQRCFCGKIDRIQTSWTKANPLQRFHVCSKSLGVHFVWRGLIRQMPLLPG
ncbi:unnamed protein product [Prunus armeniaca]